MQDIQQDDEGLGQMTIDGGPATIEYRGELLVGRASDGDEIADADQAAFGKLGKQP